MIDKPLTFHIPELVAAAVFIVLTVIGLILKYRGLLTIGKPIERRKSCMEVNKVCKEHSQMKVDVSVYHKEVLDIKAEIKHVRSDLRQINKKLDNLIIHHAQKNGVDLRR